MSSEPATTEHCPGWRDDVRPGWLVTSEPGPDGLFWGVRKDGKVKAAPEHGTLVAAMMAADVAKTWRNAQSLL